MPTSIPVRIKLSKEVHKRRTTDSDNPACGADCQTVFILERRVDSHAAELIELKSLMATNNTQTKEILDIVGLGKAFFKVLGWIGTMIKPIVAIVLGIAAVVTWIKTGSFKNWS